MASVPSFTRTWPCRGQILCTWLTLPRGDWGIVLSRHCSVRCVRLAAALKNGDSVCDSAIIHMSLCVNELLCLLSWRPRLAFQFMSVMPTSDLEIILIVRSACLMSPLGLNREGINSSLFPLHLLTGPGMFVAASSGNKTIHASV